MFQDFANIPGLQVTAPINQMAGQGSAQQGFGGRQAR